MPSAEKFLSSSIFSGTWDIIKEAKKWVWAGFKRRNRYLKWSGEWTHGCGGQTWVWERTGIYLQSVLKISGILIIKKKNSWMNKYINETGKIKKSRFGVVVTEPPSMAEPKSWRKAAANTKK